MPRWLVPPFVVAAALVPSASASAHPSITPAIVQAGQTQTFTLAIPNEKEGVSTTEFAVGLPDGIEVEAILPVDGFRRRGSGTQWTGGDVPPGEAVLVQFVGDPESARSYEFSVVQTFSDGTVSEWKSEEAASLEARSSLGGGGNTLALVLSILGVVLGAVALLLRAGGGRELA